MKIKRNLKKLAGLLLAVVMVLAMSFTVLADVETGTITIKGAIEGATYEVYRLLDLESYVSGGAHSYTVNPAWNGFFAEGTGALNYVTIENGYVTWNTNEDDATVAAFANLAQEYAKEKGINPVQSSENEGEFVIADGNGTFSELPLGYYLVDSTVSAVCGLDTTNPEAIIIEKILAPTLDKKVQEDSTNEWGKANTAQIGQEVNYKVTITAQAGAQNYVLHDTMEPGLSFNKESVKITYKNTLLESTKYSVKTEETEDGCTFEVDFNEKFCNGLGNDESIVVEYTATLNKEAEIYDATNDNTAWLEFGEGEETTHITTQTKTFFADLIKTDSSKKLIDGAEFKLYDASTGGNEIPVVNVSDGVYRLAVAGETGEEIVVTNGQVRIKGFDREDTYYLEETVAPEGYNKLTGRVPFTVSSTDNTETTEVVEEGNLEAKVNDITVGEGEDAREFKEYDNGGVRVENKSGTELPSTGGIGTTIFYILGGLLVFAAVVLMVTKKRMGGNE